MTDTKTDTELLIPLIAEFLKASPTRNYSPVSVASSLISVAASIAVEDGAAVDDFADKLEQTAADIRAGRKQ